MNEWSRRRRRIIFSSIVFALLILIGAPIFLLFYRAPNCFDGRRNGGETGIDCGGSCRLLCIAESLPLISRGDPRILELSEDLYEVVALIENPNVAASINNARYKIRLYTAKSILPVKIIEGEIYIPKGDIFAIFEGPFELGRGVIPAKALIEWQTESLVWEKNTDPAPLLEVRELVFSRENDTPRLSVILANNSLDDISNVDLTALIFDRTNSIFAASKTFVDVIPKNSEAPIIFNWPRPFSKEILNTEVLIKVLPITK